MIRIIEHGRIIESDYKVKCNMCGCVFRFGKSDMNRVYDETMMGNDDWVNHNYIRCPDCKRVICLDDKL